MDILSLNYLYFMDILTFFNNNNLGIYEIIFYEPYFYSVLICDKTVDKVDFDVFIQSVI